MSGQGEAGGWGAVAEAVRGRRDELGILWSDLAERSGVSQATIREMVNHPGRQRDGRTLAALSVALGWPAGHLAAVLAGDRPGGTPVGGGVTLLSLAAEVAELRTLVARLAEDVARITGGRQGVEHLQGHRNDQT